MIANNLKARSLEIGKICQVDGKEKYEWSRCNIKVYLNDVADAILVLAEDYLWFTHKRDIKNMEIVMILRKDGKFRGVRRMDGKLLQCNLPYLKDWMESQSMKADEYPSSENMDQSENPKHEVEHCSENTDISEPIVKNR